tara:strand:- start:2370 stop:2960 length:591 start_codon:yes stop_codon:yes gene_type:complete
MKAENIIFGPILFRCQVEQDSVNKIKSLCNQDENNSFAENLVGDFKSEYRIDREKYQAILEPQFNFFRENYNNYFKANIGNIKVVSSWVNYMKAGDFNPVHIHEDCDFSTVMFLEVPGDLVKEANEDLKGTGSTTPPGSINFFYGEKLPHSSNGRVFLPFVGHLFIFPSWLEHAVYPFKSSGNRVSVASNLIIEKI